MKQCGHCRALNGDHVHRCVSCNASLVDAIEVLGQAPPFPSTSDILRNSPYRHTGNTMAIVWGLAWSMPCLFLILASLERNGVAQSLSTGVPVMIGLFVVGYRRAKRNG